MATIPLPTALERIVDVATMPDGAAIDYNEFVITAPSPLLDADSGKSFEVKIEPIDPYKYAGAISVQYDKINLASLPPLVSDRKVDELLSNRSLFLSTLSQRFCAGLLASETSVSLAGVPAVIKNDGTAPLSGEVSLDEQSGALYFNEADEGKPIAAETTWLQSN